jgi:hypothetical protein
MMYLLKEGMHQSEHSSPRYSRACIRFKKVTSIILLASIHSYTTFSLKPLSMRSNTLFYGIRFLYMPIVIKPLYACISFLLFIKVNCEMSLNINAFLLKNEGVKNTGELCRYTLLLPDLTGCINILSAQLLQKEEIQCWFTIILKNSAGMESLKMICSSSVYLGI